MKLINPKKLNKQTRELFRRQAGDHFRLLDIDDSFNFTCIQCARCCKNRSDYHSFDTIILTPYDIIRLSRRLKVTTSDFHSRYIDFESRPRTQSAEAILRFKGDERSNICPFFADYECTVYSDRPMSCRIYPLGRLILGDEAVIIKPKKTEDCALGSGKKWKVRDWLEHMDLFHYFRFDRPWHLFRRMNAKRFNKLSAADRDYFFRCIYDIDSIVKLRKDDGTALTPDDLIQLVYELGEEILKSYGCLKPVEEK